MLAIATISSLRIRSIIIFYTLAQTCTEAGKDPGCCIFSQTHSCFVEIGGGGRGCYCDSFCTVFDDCCKDVDTSVAQQCSKQS